MTLQQKNDKLSMINEIVNTIDTSLFINKTKMDFWKALDKKQYKTISKIYLDFETAKSIEEKSFIAFGGAF